jgi:ribosome maturation factor RimP
MTAGLEQVLETTVSSLGLELVDFELANRGRMLRVFIDRPGSRPDDVLSGIAVGDCERVTRQLQRVLPVEGIDYDRLEVSSPGLDRVLKRPADFVKFAGYEAELRLRLPLEGRRKFTGVIAGADPQSVQLAVDGAVRAFALADLDKARLVPRVEFSARKPAVKQ